MATINGTNDDDLLIGTDNVDVIHGLDGFDEIHGEGGDDQIYGDDDEDLIYGGMGNDRIEGGDDDDEMYGGAGNDVLIGGDGDDDLHGGLGADDMRGGDGADDYWVDNVGDRVSDDGPNPPEPDDERTTDHVHASVSFTLGANLEHLFFTEDTGDVNGTGNSLDNRIEGSLGNNILKGLSGEDDLYGFDGNDTIEGGNGDDNLGGGQGNDSLLGGDGADVLYAGDDYEDPDGNDVLNGGAGNDELSAEGGADILIGGKGNDLYFARSIDTLVEKSGQGTDEIYASDESWTLATNFENLTVIMSSTDFLIGRGNAAANRLSMYDISSSLTKSGELYGEGGNDTLETDVRFMTMDGGSGNDTLLAKLVHEFTGGTVENTLLGGDGNDALNTRGGNDILTGGAGDDKFQFSEFDFGVAHITDFNGSGDRLEINRYALEGLDDTGRLASSLFYAGTEAQTAAQRLIYDAGADALYYDSDGNGAAAQELIIQIHVTSGTFNNQDIYITG